MDNHPIILFDGICNLCNSSVQFVIKHDEDGLFKFASLQSRAGEALLEKYSLPLNSFNSFLLIDNGRIYSRSSAALMVAKRLKGPVKLAYAFMIVPAFIRDAVYNVIAKNRYKWFGKKDECMMPTPALQSRFLKD
jgi:predicted DCC family thiol-disulfide oxidoreductase YuxK